MSMSPDSSQKETTGDCHVCEQPSHGIHFGVLSCRACAAFFRRTVVCNRQYPCRRGDDRCLIQKGTRMICRKCRYNKCVRLGMTADNVQWNRDRLNITKATPSVKTAAKEKGPEPPVDDLPRPIPRNPAQKQSWVHAIDDEAHCHIYQRLEVLFTTFDPELEFPGLWEHPSLTRMQMGLIRHRQCQSSNPEDIIILPDLNVATLKNTIEATMFRIAEWHMFSKEFVMLPLKDKLVIFHDSWKAFLRMERLQMTIEVFGSRTSDEKMFLMGDNFAVRYDEVNIDLSSVSDYDGSYLRRFFDPIMESVFERIVKPLQALNLTNIEFTYLLCQLCFHVEGMDLPYSSMDSMVEYRDKISDDLHNYYISLGQPNYAQRLIKIMGIIQAIEGVQSQKDQVMELIRIFDIIKIDGCERASRFSC